MRVLVLGGTTEARQLVEALGARAMLSLAGATAHPLAGPHRVGGFGGAIGLADFVQAGNFCGLIDATHPFAAEISRNAVKASTLAGVPLLRLIRPPWPVQAGWEMVGTLETTAQALPAGSRVFLSVGRQSLAPFLEREDIWFLTRSIELPSQLPRHGMAILQRPPFTLEGEMALMKGHEITHLVSKQAGGASTCAKLEAATRLGVRVLMVKRPPLPRALEVETVAKAVKWVKTLGD